MSLFLLAASCLLSPVPLCAAGPPPSSPQDRIPAFELLDLDGGSHSFDWSSASGSPALFFFFEPRSAAALLEMKFLAKLASRLRDKGITVVAVEGSGLDSGELAEKRQRLFPDTLFPVVSDPDYRLSRIFGVRDVPSTYIVGPGGAVLCCLEGFTRSGPIELTKMIVGSLPDKSGSQEASAAMAEFASPSRALEPLPDEEAPPALLAVGDRAAPFEAVDLGGNPVSADWAAQGARVHIVFFWGAMCLPCMREMTYLEEIYGRTKDQGLRIYAVQATGLSPERTAIIMKRYERVYPAPTFPIIPDADHRIRETFGVKKGGPATFFVNRGGEVTFAIDDFAQGYENTMATKIERALHMETETIALSRNADGKSRSGNRAGLGEDDGTMKGMFEENLARGDYYFSVRSFDKALPCYLKALSIEPGDIHVLCRVACIYEQKGRIQAARQQWEKVLALDAGNAEAHRHLKELDRSPDSARTPG